MSKELEIKVLNIDKEQLEHELINLGCKKKEDIFQKFYVYDVQTIRGLYHSIIADWGEESSGMDATTKERTKQLFFDLDSIADAADYKELANFLNVSRLIDICNHIQINEYWYKTLTHPSIMSIIDKYGVNPNKWIRLRANGKKAELTIKHISSSKEMINGIMQYGIDSINEYEVAVDSFEKTDEILNALGFYHRSYQEKKRSTYLHPDHDLEIVIDSWPMIPPYMEIEGSDVNEIMDFAKSLGFTAEDVLVCNTADVYEKYGLNIFDYKELKFPVE